MYHAALGGTLISCEPERFGLEIVRDGIRYRFRGVPEIRFKNGEAVTFKRAKCESGKLIYGTSRGVRAKYTHFAVPKVYRDAFSSLAVIVEAELTTDGALRVSVYLENEPEDGLAAIVMQPMRYGAKTGYTVLPRMQGTLLPARCEKTIKGGHYEGIVFEREAYMPVFGQVYGAEGYGRGCGYTAIFDTPYDARYIFDHEPGGDTQITPMFVSSLGRIGYKRVMLYRFSDALDYTGVAKTYRAYLKEKGRLVTLRQKIAVNPAIARLIGTPVIHTGIARHIAPESDFYDPDDPAANDVHTAFRTRARQLRGLKAAGVERAYLHLDGWGRHGYDNLHPSPFPPHKKAGGAEGMKALADTCRELGYVFGIHDQYRDYYFDGPDFDPDNAVKYENGTRPYHSRWDGGRHTFLCASLAPEYVKRNYDEFERLGIRIEGTYLDVFSVVELDECFNPRHRMTREMCAEYRRECFHAVNSRGIIPSSEETMDCIVPAIALCHHAPHYNTELEENSEHIGVPVPLFNLVWHDCIITPYFAIGGTWGIPLGYDPLGLAYINGGTVYADIEGNTPEEYAKLSAVLELHEKIADREMLRHEIIDGDPKRQRSVFDSPDGEIIVDVDFTVDRDAKIRVSYGKRYKSAIRTKHAR